jgi:hypothetical protein
MLSQHSSGHSHTRNYIVIITLVIGAIFLFLFLNNNSEGVSLTSAFVGGSEDPAAIGEESGSKSFFSTSEKTDEEEEITKIQKIDKSKENIDLEFTFDQIPEVNKEAKLEEISLTFDDLSTKINVNNDYLELNNLKSVNLKIEDFEGNIEFNDLGASIEGTAKTIAVNDIALISRGEIKVSFEDLDYGTLNVKGLELKQLDLPEGNGDLKIGEKLQYSLYDEELSLYKFNGELTLVREGDVSLEMKGLANSLGITGEELTLNLN